MRLCLAHVKYTVCRYQQAALLIFYLCFLHLHEMYQKVWFLFSIIWGGKFNFPFNKVSAFSTGICNACFFILSRGWIGSNLLVFFFSLYRGCKGTYFRKTASSFLVSFLVFFSDARELFLQKLCHHLFDLFGFFFFFFFLLVFLITS